MWIAHNHNRDCASCIPLVHVVQDHLREKCRQNRTRFRLCSPLLNNKKQCNERKQKSSSGSPVKVDPLEAVLVHGGYPHRAACNASFYRFGAELAKILRFVQVLINAAITGN
jgi:hypothetical protein